MDSPDDSSDDTAPRTAVVPGSAAGSRFDAVLAELFPQYSRTRLSEWIKSGDVRLDGEIVRGRDSVRGGEV
ncbi:MAG: S4 domain-containing protein, partial [Pseudoxanthomonas sp.]